MTEDIKMICHKCVGEEFLKAEIQSKGKKSRCSYCSKVRRSYSIYQISEKIEGAFERHYIRTAQDPDSFQEAMLRDKESDYNWFRDGDPVDVAIKEAASISEQAAKDIQELLKQKHTTKHHRETSEECEFDDDSYYEFKAIGSDHWERDWSYFERSLKTETRFFNSGGLSHLKAVFDGIEAMSTHDGRRAIVTAGPGKEIPSLYRARVFQSNDKLKYALSYPDEQLGTPSSAIAMAGRMNAAGIPVFYGATDPKLAIAEVRPPVGSQVAVARFDFVREVRLLDLIALSSVSNDGSIFDKKYASRLQRAVFLRDLSARITKPVLPDDAPFEYLPTQAISDYLAADPTLNLDGIIFPSSQVPGSSVNIVLFSKAAMVEKITLIDGSEVTASTELWDEDGPSRYYQVSVAKPKKIGKSAGRPAHDLWGDELPVSETTSSSTLKIDLDSIRVHIIKAVEVNSEEYDVHRHEYDKSDFSEFGLRPPAGWE